ncbi:MaoC/PaaZ C-terminal domain-containing protein [Frondihabitans sp. PAMC 28766]|uniref:MaoC/PaaZ C-terminal domain-containing protein n=1 Tax=Frondihabitans sp. PAMC 28766 TaxID=1795630 RepID=UPI0026B83A24
MDPRRPRRRSGGPFGETIAHGYLTLSLIPKLARDAYALAGFRMLVNYGLDRVRFPAIVPSGSRVRDRATLLSADPGERGMRIVVRHTVEIDGATTPGCVADSITLLVPDRVGVATHV